MTLTCVILYILAGLLSVPIFGLGGGIKYIAQYGFGYIIAYIPAILIVGKLLTPKYTFLDMLKATFAGVFTIHILGMIYMIIIALIRQTGSHFITSWISAQSGLKIIYDLIAGFLLILIGKYLHEGFKYITD